HSHVRPDRPELPQQLHVFFPGGVLARDNQIKRARPDEKHRRFIIRRALHVPAIARHHVFQQILNFAVRHHKKQLLPFHERRSAILGARSRTRPPTPPPRSTVPRRTSLAPPAASSTGVPRRSRDHPSQTPPLPSLYDCSQALHARFLPSPAIPAPPPS